MLDFENPKIQGSWRGEVKDRNDPEQNKRLKVYIEPLHENISDEDLPWAVPENGGQLGASDDGSYGEGGVPEENSWVKVTFDQGDPSCPIWHGTIEPADTLPDRFLGKEDSAYNTMDSNLESIETAPEKGSYPDSRGWVLGSGIVLEAQDNPDNTRMLVFHPSGFRFEVLDSGVHVKHVEGNLEEVVIGNKDVYVDGERVKEITGNSTTNTGKTHKIEAQDKIELVVGGSSITIDPDNITVDANSDVHLNP